MSPFSPPALALACIHSELASSRLPAKDWANQADWQSFIGYAEQHALAPIAYRQITASSISPPSWVMRSLKALTLRHRLATEARRIALGELSLALKGARISFVVLKGAALAHMVYRQPELRPMRDIDVLIRPEDKQRAKSVLVELGYEMESGHSSQYMGGHHHLPNAIKLISGMTNSVEMHVNAVSGDVPDSIALEDITSALRVISAHGLNVPVLGHVDMLRHLCRHSFEPAAEIQLIHVFDIVAYAERFHEEIDWQLIVRRFPHVIATLRCLNWLLPLSPQLTGIIGIPQKRPRDVGLGMRPLSFILNSSNGIVPMLSELLIPPAWWTHGHYGIDPDRSLFFCRLFTHPITLGRWLSRRVKARLGA